MKTIFFVVSFLTLTTGNDFLSELKGKWKLEKIKTKNEIFIPSTDYFLEISENGFYYNRDMNSCFAHPVITKKNIKFDRETCTMVCCDGHRDTIGGILRYDGLYQLTDSTLTIVNELGKIYLKRNTN